MVFSDAGALYGIIDICIKFVCRIRVNKKRIGWVGWLNGWMGE